MTGPLDGAPPPSSGGPVERGRQHWWQHDHLADDEPPEVPDIPDDAPAPERHDIVEYDLSEWTQEQRDAIVEQLEIEHIGHEWTGAHLHVPGAHEANVDELVDAIDGLPDAVDDEVIEYEFADWTPQQTNQLVEALVAAEISCVWDGSLLTVGEADEARVDALVLEIDPSFPVTGSENEEPPPEDPPKSGWGPIIGDILDGISKI